MMVNGLAILWAQGSRAEQGAVSVRELPVRLPPPRPLKEGSPMRDVFFFIVAFGAVFLSALLVMRVFGF